MARQPFNQLFSDQMAEVVPALPGADYIHFGGVFIGIHNHSMTDAMFDLLISAYNSFPWAEKKD
jgi:hypothetical protein